MTTTARVRDALRAVVDPCSAATGSHLDVVEMGLVKSIEVDGCHVDVELRLTTPACHMVAFLANEAETHVGSLSGVESVHVTADNGVEWTEEMMTDAAKERRQAVLAGYEARYADRL